MNPASEITILRRNVLTKVAQWLLNHEGNQLTEQAIKELVVEIIPAGPARYRCCIFKERAIAEDRIRIAMGAGSDEDYLVTVIPEACNGCSLNKFIVTDACQNCVAHPCRNSCPKKAISVVQTRAYIDNNSCVECGICAKSCPYHAIVEISRPCERSCAMGAITFDEDRRAVINGESCVSCGLCVTVCPFGAITDTSKMKQVIVALKDKGQPTVAVVAPAVAGQFGPKATLDHIKSALLQLGFDDVIEAAKGADVVALWEAEEIKEHLDQKLMTNSCCPAHAKAIKIKMPELADKVSTALSPMRVTGQLIKDRYNNNVTTVFIGPCIAKKAEIRMGNEIDYAITFEELAAILSAAEIVPADCEPVEMSDASPFGRLFARTGGVCGAVARHLTDVPMEVIRAQGLRECLTALKSGAKQAAGDQFVFVEGMGCEGGCVGGPGSLIRLNVATRAVEKYAGKIDK
ncbi:monomeric [FeFe] hydrogenase [Peptococcaceae bacterium 1198_IL3148]